MIIQISLGIVLGFFLLGLLSQFSGWRSRRRVEKRIRRLDAPPRVPLFRRVVAGVKYEIDLLRHYKYTRHQMPRRIF